MNRILSLMVTMHNSESTVERTINSIVPQLTEETELVVIDDGSRDKCFDIAKKITARLKNCKIVRQHNLGAIVARKNGFDLCEGEYCWAIDCGDTINVNSIRTILSEIKKSHHDIYVFNTTRINKDKISTSKISITDEPLKDLLLGRIMPSLWSKVIKRKLLYKTYNIEVQKLILATDLYVSCDALSQTKDVGFIKESLYTYIIEPNSMTTSRKRDLGIIDSIKLSKIAITNNIDYEEFKNEFEYFVFNQLIVKYIFMMKNRDNIDKFHCEYKKYNINEKLNEYIGYRRILINFIPLEKILPFKDSIIKKALCFADKLKKR